MSSNRLVAEVFHTEASHISELVCVHALDFVNSVEAYIVVIIERRFNYHREVYVAIFRVNIPYNVEEADLVNFAHSQSLFLASSWLMVESYQKLAGLLTSLFLWLEASSHPK